MRRKNGCQCPWKWHQTVSFVVWFVLLAGCYALYIPVLQGRHRTAVVACYTAAAVCVTAAYIAVCVIDPSDAGSASGAFYCDQCQLFVQHGSKHCKECQKCVLGFDHHCKWVNNCIGTRNYRPFLALLALMCGMLGLQLGTGLRLAAQALTAADAAAARLADAYPVTHLSSRGCAAALLVYSCFIAVALYPLADLLLLHIVLAARGLTTWDYIMANRDAAVEPSPLARSAAKLARSIRSLGGRSGRVQDEEAAGHGASGSGSGGGSGAVSPRRRVGINPCLACRTDVSSVAQGRSSSQQGGGSSPRATMSRPRPEFDAVLVFPAQAQCQSQPLMLLPGQQELPTNSSLQGSTAGAAAGPGAAGVVAGHTAGRAARASAVHFAD